MFKRIFFSAMVAALLAPQAEASAQVVVIVNEGNPASSLSQDDVRAYFMKAEPRWRNGEKVRPIDQTGSSAERGTFISTVLGISDAEFERYWIEKQYASAEQPPVRAPNPGAVITLVKSFEGGIGFVSQAVWEAADQTGVKVVYTVDG